MRRLATLWLTLLAAFWLSGTAVSALLFGHAEANREVVWSILCIPAAQTLLLGFLTRAPGSSPLAVWRELGSSAWLRGVLALDLVVLAGGAIAAGRPLPGLPLDRLVDGYTGVKLGLAGLGFGGLVARGRGGRDAWIWLSLWGRARLALLAVGLLALASVHLSSRTLGGLDLALGELYEEYPAIVFAALLALGLGLLLAVLPLFHRRSPTVALALEIAAACGWVAGLLMLLASLPEPRPGELWSGATAVFATLSATFLTAAAVLALFPRRAAGAGVLLLATLGLTAPLTAQAIPAAPRNLGFEEGGATDPLPGWIPSPPAAGVSFPAPRSAAPPR
jgi:hypothetical protein